MPAWRPSSAKLLIQCEPDIALFGEKDYQQLKVVTQLARDLDLKTRIVGAPIVREADGLALSSRNVYLSPREREAAPTLYRVLERHAPNKIAAGKPIAAVLTEGREAITSAGFALDYLEARHARDAGARRILQRTGRSACSSPRASARRG